MRRILLFLLLAGSAFAQNRFPHINIVNSLPTGVACPLTPNNLEQYGGDIFVCDPITLHYRVLSGGGPGGGGLNPGTVANLVQYATTTVGGPAGGLNAIGTGMGGISFTDLSTHNMLQPLGTTNPGTGVCPTGANYFSATIGTELYCNIYAQQLTNNQAFTGIGLFTNLLAGNLNENSDGINFKPGVNPLNIVTISNTGGSMNGLSLYSYQNGQGDNFGIFNLVYCNGGTSAQGDEGCENNDEWDFGAWAEYSGVVASGAGAGSTSVTITPNSGAPAEQSVQASGRWLWDGNPSNIVNAGHITNITTVSPGNTPPMYTGTGTSWPVSTVQTTVTSPSFIGEHSTTTVTPASMAGISVGTVLFIADKGNAQQVKVLSTTATTFTAAFNEPQAAGALVYSGGLSGYYAVMDGDVNAADGITATDAHLGWPVIGTPSATTALIWSSHAGGGFAGYRGSCVPSSGSGCTYKMYPAAKVSAVNNGTLNVTNTLTLAPNTVNWQVADAVNEAVYPDITQQHGNAYLYPNFDTGNDAGYFWGFGRGFANVAGQGGGGAEATMVQVTNQNPDSFYTGNFSRPVGFEMLGPWSDFVHFYDQPTNGIVQSTTCNNGTGVCGQTTVLDLYGGTNNHDYLTYTPATGFLSPGAGYWRLTTNGAGFSAPQYITFIDGTIQMLQGAVQMDGRGGGNFNTYVSSIAGGTGAYQNQIKDSQFQTANTVNWTEYNCDNTTPTYTPNTTDIVTPWGDNTALKIVSGAGTGTTGACAPTGQYSQLFQNITTVTGHVYEYKGWYASNINQPNNSLQPTINNVTNATVTPKTTWQSFDYQGVESAGATRGVVVITGLPNMTVYLWNLQVCDLTVGGCMFVNTQGSAITTPQLGQVVKGVPQSPVNGSGTIGFVPEFTASTVIGNSPFDDGVTTPGVVTSSKPIAVSGPPMFKTGTASNSDVTGELSFSSSTTASYTWANTYASHPECHGIEPQFDIGAGNYHWVTYTGTSSFTINFHSAVTGAVSYGCTGRN